MTAEPPELRVPIRMALDAIHEHPQLESQRVGLDMPWKDWASVELIVKLDLPIEWMARGTGLDGVRASETVTLLFPPMFPLRAPRIRLRSDFNRELPHLFPGPVDQPPEPCVYDGNLSELQNQRGFSAVLEQMILWLENAARRCLVDPAQGWEPVRRDSLDDWLVADTEHLRSFVGPNGGSVVFEFSYLRWMSNEKGHTYRGVVQANQLQLRPETIDGWFFEKELPDISCAALGRSLAIVVWPPKGSSKHPRVTDRYLAETVVDVESLRVRAGAYHCSQQLNRALQKLEKCRRRLHHTNHRQPIVIILVARRPFHLIGSKSKLEVCPYIIETRNSPASQIRGGTRVRTAGHLDAIGTGLLRSMSGYSANGDAIQWTQLGAGSLGSKIAIHLARAGYAPTSIIDHAFLRPHNYARHALLPPLRSPSSVFIPRKSEALREAIEGLGQTASAYSDDIVNVTKNSTAISRRLPADHWAVVNSTASLQVREALVSIPRSRRIPRVIETSLYARGQVGVLTVEGPCRNPDTSDLALEAFHLMAQDETLSAQVFDDTDGVQRHSIGEGCGSMTMAMSDGQVSMMAAPMSEIVLKHQHSGLPDSGGRVHLGRVQDDGFGVVWQMEETAPWQVLNVADAPEWKVRISDRAHRKILGEFQRQPQVETGGVLIGAFSEASQTFRIIDVLQAPHDSTCERDEFVLGTVGLRERLDECAPKHINCLGTWHTHLSESGPSKQDLCTAALVGESRTEPSVLLIRTPTTYRAVLANRRHPPTESRGSKESNETDHTSRR